MSIISWLTNKSIERFAKGISKAQLNTLFSLQKRNPELKGKDLYEQVIILRPSYDSEKAKKIIYKAKEAFNDTVRIRMEKRKFGFRDVVETLVAEEYYSFKGKTLPKDDVNAFIIIAIVVREIIPSEL